MIFAINRLSTPGLVWPKNDVYIASNKQWKSTPAAARSTNNLFRSKPDDVRSVTIKFKFRWRRFNCGNKFCSLLRRFPRTVLNLACTLSKKLSELRIRINFFFINWIVAQKVQSFQIFHSTSFCFVSCVKRTTSYAVIRCARIMFLIFNF